jgi:effector-binding domain-containing protein
VTAFLAIAAPVLVSAEHRSAGVQMDELPACDVAVLEHRGPYEGLASCYRRLGAWVAFHATPTELPVRELYRTPIDGPAEQAITELHWPVAELGE